MKAKPVKIVKDDEGYEGYVECLPDEATHLTLRFPSPAGLITLPVMIGGTREGTENWTWNGSTDKPTLKPSVRTKGHNYLCHSWINDGKVKFLDDCTHELAGQTVDLGIVE